MNRERKKARSNRDLQALANKVKVESDNAYEYESCQKIIHGGSLYVSEYSQGSKHKRLMHVYYLSDYF